MCHLIRRWCTLLFRFQDLLSAPYALSLEHTNTYTHTHTHTHTRTHATKERPQERWVRCLDQADIKTSISTEQEGQPDRIVGSRMRRRVVERRTEGEHKQQEEVMWLTRVQNSSGGCNNTDPVSLNSEPVELKFYLTNISTPVCLCVFHQVQKTTRWKKKL